MTFRQKVLKFFYPVILQTRNLTAAQNLVLYNSTNTKPKTSFYDLQEITNNGTAIKFEQFKGKKVLIVNKSANQNQVFQWLTDKNKNGWNDHQPVWNFSKYLINEVGKLMYYFDPAVSPMSNVVINAITRHPANS